MNSTLFKRPKNYKGEMIGLHDKTKLMALTPNRIAYRYPKDFTGLSKLKAKLEEAPMVPKKWERSPKDERQPKRSKTSRGW